MGGIGGEGLDAYEGNGGAVIIASRVISMFHLFDKLVHQSKPERIDPISELK